MYMSIGAQLITNLRRKAGYSSPDCPLQSRSLIHSYCPIFRSDMQLFMEELQNLMHDLKSSDAATREEAAHALYDIGHDSKPAVPLLFNAILRETGACPWVGTALMSLGPLAPDMEAMKSALRSENYHVRFDLYKVCLIFTGAR